MTDKLISVNKKYKTYDGRDVRVLCVDAPRLEYPVLALVDGGSTLLF